MELVQGLGRGGVERALLDRLAYAPLDVRHFVVNVRPSIDTLNLEDVPSLDSVVILSRASNCQLARIIDQWEPDVIVFRTPRDMMTWAPRLNRHFPGVRVVFEAHSEVISPRRPGLGAVVARSFAYFGRFVDLHIAASQRVARGEQCRGARKSVVHYFGTSVNPAASSELTSVPGVRFLFLGRFVEGKRPRELAGAVLDMADEVRASGSVLTMMGDGPERQAIEQLVQDVDGSDVVEVLPARENPQGVMASSDVLVIPSLREGLPLVAFEARRMGLRIITTPAGGTSEILGPDDVLCEDFSMESLSEAMRRMINLGRDSVDVRRSRSEDSAEFDASVTVPRYYEILRELVEHRSILEILTGPIEGGIPTTLRTRLHHAPRGVETVLLCPPTSWIEAQAPAESFPCPVFKYQTLWSALRGIRSNIRERRPDCLIAHTERDLWWAIVGKLLSGSRVPITYVIHNDVVESRRILRRLTPVALRAARPFVARVIAVSQETRNGEMGRCFPQVQIRLQPPELSATEVSTDPDGGPVFLAAKRLVPSKGIDRVVKGALLALPALRSAQARVIVAGDGPDKGQLEMLVKAAAADDVVDFRGWVDDMDTLFGAADYFLQPSLHEGAGMSLIEALTAGLVVASSPRGLARDILPEDPDSTLFPDVPSASDWAEWMSRTALDPKLPPTRRLERIDRFSKQFDPHGLTAEFYEAVPGYRAWEETP